MRHSALFVASMTLFLAGSAFATASRRPVKPIFESGGVIGPVGSPTSDQVIADSTAHRYIQRKLVKKLEDGIGGGRWTITLEPANAANAHARRFEATQAQLTAWGRINMIRGANQKNLKRVHIEGSL